MKKKMLFEEPELEVVRFDPKDIYTEVSGDCGVDDTGECEGFNPACDGVCPSDDDF